MRFLLTLLAIIQLFSCSQADKKNNKNWLCENKKELLKSSINADTVRIDLSKSSSDQLNDLRNQLPWNPCNETYLLNGKINLSDSTNFLVAYRARPFCKDDTIIRPPNCFPDPTISVYFISDTLIEIENNLINLNRLSEDEKYFSFEDWNMFRKKIFEFNSHKMISAKVKEKILKRLLRRHFEILDSICLTRRNKNICELGVSQIDSLKNLYPVYFAQTEFPPIPINSDFIEDDNELEIDLSLKE